MSSESLSHELHQLSRKSLTTLTLSALDFVIPGTYQNLISLEDMVQMVTGDVRIGRLQAIANHVDQLYAKNDGARRAVKLYQLTDLEDRTLDITPPKSGETVEILSFKSELTPKSETRQSIDFCLKLTAEGIAHLSINGLNTDAVDLWVSALTADKTFGYEEALRLASIIGLEGLAPLGEDFLSKVGETLDDESTDFSESPLYGRLSEFIPGETESDKSAFARDLVRTLTPSLEGFMERTGLNRERVIGGLQRFTDLSDDNHEYLSSFLDATTSCMRRTGIQTVARHLVKLSASRFGYDSLRTVMA